MAVAEKTNYKGIVILETPRPAASAMPEDGATENTARRNQWSLRWHWWLSGLALAALAWILLSLLFAQKQLLRQLHDTQRQLRQQAQGPVRALPDIAPYVVAFGSAQAQRWWIFDGLQSRWLHQEPELDYLGSDSLELKGRIRQWYGGGTGTYLGLDAQHYTHLSLNILGYGGDSGVLKIELLDDDNRNYQADYRSVVASLNQDDLWVCSIPVTWSGWRHVNLPFQAFDDANPGVGDDVWNPSQWLGSGGLLQLQWIAVGKRAMGNFHIRLNQPRLLQIKEKKQ